MVLPPLSYEEFLYESAHIKESRQVPLIVGTVVLFGASALAVTLRIWARRIQGLRLAWNDYTIIFSLVTIYSRS